MVEYINYHPWGTGSVDLSQVYLSKADKDWLGDRVITDRIRSGKLSDHFSLNDRAIRRYAKKRKNKHINYCESGRPKCIDSISDNIVRGFYGPTKFEISPEAGPPAGPPSLPSPCGARHGSNRHPLGSDGRTDRRSNNRITGIPPHPP